MVPVIRLDCRQAVGALQQIKNWGRGMETKAGATPNSEAEKKAVKCFAAFTKVEDAFHKAEEAFNATGKAFGQAVVELREEIKASGDRDFMARLELLGISYAKARYWMDAVEGKPMNRHKKELPKEQNVPIGLSPRVERPAFDWNAALARLENLRDDIYILKQSQPDGSELLVAPLKTLAETVGYQLQPIWKGGNNA